MVKIFRHKWCQLHWQERRVQTIKGELGDAIGMPTNHLIVNNIRAQSFVPAFLVWMSLALK